MIVLIVLFEDFTGYGLVCGTDFDEIEPVAPIRDGDVTLQVVGFAAPNPAPLQVESLHLTDGGVAGDVQNL